MTTKNLLITILFTIFSAALISAKISPTKLTCEYLHNPAVVDVLQPRLAWINIVGENERGQIQTAYQIRVATSKEKLEKPDLWDSGKT